MPLNYANSIPQINFAAGLNAIGDNIKNSIDQAKIENALTAANGDWNQAAINLAKLGYVNEAAKMGALGIAAQRTGSYGVTKDAAGNPVTYSKTTGDIKGAPVEVGPFAGMNPEQIAAQKAQDAAFAKTMPDWISGGQAEKEQSLGSLDEALSNLSGLPQDKIGASSPQDVIKASKGQTGVSGPVPGILGTIAGYAPYGPLDQFATMGQLMKGKPGYAAANYPKALSTSSAHVRAVVGGMKAILGGQRSQAVIQQVINSTYNSDLPPEDNAARLERLRANIVDAGKAKDAQVEYYKKNHTLLGYNGPTPESIIESGMNDFQAAGSGNSAPKAQPTPAQQALFEQHKNDPGFVAEWNKRFGQ